MLYPNNSVVDVGTSTILYCLTNNTNCCRETDGSSAGEWFLPGQIQPVIDVNGTFIRTRGPSAVLLNISTVVPTGIYTCQIPDQSGQLRTAYVGVDTGI